jgi:peptidase S46-like protein
MKSWLSVLCLALGLTGTATADEGMWLFDHPPTRQVKAKYGFDLTQRWLDHTRLSSVRFNNGGSGSFVSANGLTFTNHHVAQTCLYGLSSKERDLYKAGFYAKTQAEEAKCPDLELNVLMDMEDATSKVNAGVTPEMPAAEAGTKQRANMSKVEADCSKSTGLRCDVVTLYAGGMFALYQYKKYTDVRLVFAPEFDVAFFGGDPDNFEYPRYDLDIAFFRIYEHDKPVHLDNYLKWSTTGVKENELVFVSGHPGSTDRLDTVAQLAFLRDTAYPLALDSLTTYIGALEKFSSESAEHARIAQNQFFGFQNSFKAIKGFQSGLLEKDSMAKKAAEEVRTRMGVESNPREKQEFGDPWTAVAAAMKVEKDIYLPLSFVERMAGFRGELPSYARTLVRVAAEKQKPNSERLREYRESNLPSLEQHLFSTAPVYKSLDTVMLAVSLQRFQQKLPEDPALKYTLNDRTPADIAKELIAGTRLDDPDIRKQLYEGGEAAIEASTDPLIVLMRAIDSEAREFRKQYDDKIEAVERVEGAKIAKIQFAEKGLNAPPDATFTLRLSYGAVRGYAEDGRGTVRAGTKLPYFTTIGGAFRHAADHNNERPYKLPESWVRNKDKLNLATPLNIVATPDIIGGNSGSPVVNRAGEVVGIIFDGNIQSLSWRFVYEDRTGRSLHVDSRGILEVLRHVYSADRLADELTVTSRSRGAPGKTRRREWAPTQGKPVTRQSNDARSPPLAISERMGRYQPRT